MTDLPNDPNAHSGDHWGNCEGCQYWQSDEHGALDHEVVGQCMQPELVHVQLRVSAHSGCNRFKPTYAEAGMALAAGERKTA